MIANFEAGGGDVGVDAWLRIVVTKTEGVDETTNVETFLSAKVTFEKDLDWGNISVAGSYNKGVCAPGGVDGMSGEVNVYASEDGRGTHTGTGSDAPPKSSCASDASSHPRPGVTKTRSSIE